MTSLGFLAATPGVASAEINSARHTTWGVATKGASNTISRWDALSWAVDQVGGTIYVGGNYLNVTNGYQTESQPYLAAFDADTGNWQSWFRPNVGNAVFAMAPSPDGGLFVGGEMGTWNGQQLGGLAKIDPATGELWPGWQTRVFGGSSVVRDLKIESDGKLYVVGSFTDATQGNGPMSVDGAIRLDPITGVIDASWIPRAHNGAVWGVSRSATQNVTYLAGFFQDIGSVTNTRGFAGVNDSGAVVVNRDIIPFNGCSSSNYCSQLYDVEATEFGHIWVGGVEHALYIVNESNGALVQMHYTGCDPSRNATCEPGPWYGGEFQELERAGNRIYATCHCWYDLFSDTQVMRHARPNENPGAVHRTTDALMAFDVATSNHIPSFRPYLNGDAGGFSMHLNESDGCLWAAGGFDSYGAPGGAQPPARDLVRICDETGPGPAAGPAPVVPSPTDCVLSGDAGGVTLTWTIPTGATRVIVQRQVDTGGWYWRGAANVGSAQMFSELPAQDTVSRYRVKATYSAGQQSEYVACGADLDLSPNLTAPSVCSGTINAQNQVELVWTAGNDATDYIVRRSVDGGNFWWRGRVSDVSFTGSTLQLGRNYDYQVTALDAAGGQAGPTNCGSFEIASPDVQPVSVCSASVGGGDVVILSWDASTNATGYIVRRSVNGGTSYWRGRINDGGNTSYTGAAIQVGNTYDYTVEAIRPDGTKTNATNCGPTLELATPIVDAPLACDAVVDATGAVTVNYTMAEIDADAVIYRSANGGTFYWRGRQGPGLDYVHRLDCRPANLHLPHRGPSQ